MQRISLRTESLEERTLRLTAIDQKTGLTFADGRRRTGRNLRLRPRLWNVELLFFFFFLPFHFHFFSIPTI